MKLVKLYETGVFKILKMPVDYSIFVSDVEFTRGIFGGIITTITTNFSCN